MKNQLAVRRRAAVVALVIAGLVFVATPAAAQDGGLSLGVRTPSATVQALDGKALELSTVVGGGPALIEFWAAWCPNCKELEPALSAAQKKYGAQVRFVTVAVNINESIDRVRKHVAAHGTPGTVVYDADGKAAGAYDAPATSYIVVIDRTGRVVYTGVGGAQDIDAAIKKAL
jgi:thiol-disulfide isomerase/thioredoxin